MLGRLVVITGVSRGLGRALVQVLASQGHRIAGCCRSTELAAKLRRQYGAEHSFSSVDVSDNEAVTKWAADVLETGGVPDLIVNNAAVINRNAPLWMVSRQEFDHLINVNVCGTANVIRAFLPAMIARQSGVIVNLSSGWGRSTSPDVAPYCASKWAIEGLTGSLAQELPGGLAAVSLNPGIINTDMLASAFGASARAYPTPDEWAPAAVALLLSLGPADNGAALTVEM